MNFRAVRYFEEVAATGSLRAAAERLRIAGSALSRMIGILEHQLGVKLFNRSRGGMTLTAAGEIYLRYARGLTLDLDRLRAEMEELKGLRRGHIRLASIEGAVGDLAMKAIREFRRDFPQVTFELRAGGADSVTSAVTNREADVGIGANGTYDKGIKVILRAASPLLALVSPASTWFKRRKEISLAEVLAECPVAVPDGSFALRRQLEECAVNAGAKFVPALVTNSIDALRSFAMHGSGATFLPRVAVRDDLETGRIMGIVLRDAILNASSIDLLVTDDRQLTPAGVEFLRYLTDILVRHSDLRPRERAEAIRAAKKRHQTPARAAQPETNGSSAPRADGPCRKDASLNGRLCRTASRSARE